MNLNKLFLVHCEDKEYEINQNQIDIIDKLRDFYSYNFNQNFLKKFFKKKKSKLGFYLVGDVGVGKTMILNFFFATLKEKKLRLHFNEFMIKFHNHIFENKDIEVAAAETLLLNGGGSTDYGQAFVDLAGLLENNIDRKTTVIILGDARANYGDPRCDVLKTIQEKSKRILFLNPEPKSVWGTGDSEMLRFVPYCSKSKVCSSLLDLERVVDDMLRSSI